VVLTVVGIITTVIAVILLSASRAGEGNRVKGGGVILFGPFPIIFGTDKQSLKIAIVLAIVLMIIALIATLVFYFMLR
jgi:uncharacterized protein (TIGR00304 family)